MKIAYVLGTFPCLSETFILREIAELRHREFDILLFALRRPDPEQALSTAGDPASATCYRPPLLSWAAAAAVLRFLVCHPVRLIRAFGWALPLATQAPVEMLRCLRNLPAAAFFASRAQAAGVRHIHAHFAFMPTDVARMMAELMGVGFSFSAHAGDIYLQRPAALARKIRAARFVTVCTRYGLEELGRRIGGTLPAHVHRVYHGIVPDSFGTASSVEPVVLAVGRLQPKKGFATLMEACRILRERGIVFRCVIAGEGPERANLETARARHRLGDVVRLVGVQTPEQVAALLRTARVFALPCTIAPDGDRDSLPNVLLEALAAGVPVVTTPVAGIPELIEDGRTGRLTRPDDATGLADSIEELLKDDALCRTMAVLGKARVADRFDIVRNIEPLAALFRETQEAL